MTCEVLSFRLPSSLLSVVRHLSIRSTLPKGSRLHISSVRTSRDVALETRNAGRDQNQHSEQPTPRRRPRRLSTLFFVQPPHSVHKPTDPTGPGKIVTTMGLCPDSAERRGQTTRIVLVGDSEDGDGVAPRGDHGWGDGCDPRGENSQDGNCDSKPGVRCGCGEPPDDCAADQRADDTVNTSRQSPY